MQINEAESELERRRQELEQKAAELEAREAALRQGTEFKREHNWPPLPSICPIKPCFFQDINVDIRPEFQRTVQLGYQLWMSFVLVQLLNLIATIVLTVNDSTSGHTPYALVTVIFFIPLTYMAWFRPLYNAFKNDSSFNFMIFFFVFFMQTLIVGLWSLGIPFDGPACGLFVALKNMGINPFATTYLFLVAFAWIAYAVGSVFYLIKVHSIYRSSGASMSKARNEFAQGVISNRYVQQTVANAARQTVNQTFNPAGASSQAPPTSNQPTLPTQIPTPLDP